MLIRTINFREHFRCVVYLRMSGKKQNERSPDQQNAEIEHRIKQLGYNFTVVKVYRDDAVTGRYVRKRKQYQQMLRDIKLGLIQVDFILVDTFERFGRHKQLRAVRERLHEKCGVLVLTADTNFADPTTPQGQALGSFEAMRATEDGRIKAHNVFRGKRDVCLLKHWPGGPAPFGYMLHSVMKEVNGCQEVDHRIPVPEPATDWIIKRLMHRADQTGHGQTRLTRWLNNDPEIPEEFKPFQAPTVGYWLDNPIYVGDLLWAEHSTDIIDDARVIALNAPENMIFVPDFCEPLVPREVWNRIQTVRNARRRPKAKDNTKRIAPLAPGLTLKYLLTGLVRCGHCHRSMAPSSSSIYVTVAGDERRYTTYVCPGYLEGVCPNSQRVPEPWLREVVVGRIRDLLFPKAE